MSMTPFRAVLSIVVLFTLVAFSFAEIGGLRPESHDWIVSALLPSYATSGSISLPDVPRLMTAGTCDTAGPIEVEGSVLGTTPTAYTTLGAAFTAINAGTHTGSISIDVCGDTSEGTATATLNASGSGSASYTSILMSPAGGASRTISGATTAGAPMIDFNGADNVTINGLNTGGNSLTISNTTASATSGTATIRFIGGATGNTITNSTILGAGTMSVATNGATIFFSTDAVTANGNDSNLISNNNIGPVGANLPTKAILCNGSTTTQAIGNSGNIVDNNNIFDFFGAAVTSSGIASNGGCNSWTITNNRLYQTGTRTWTTGAAHVGIDIRPATATSGAQGFTITGNTIGYASNTQTGIYTLTGAGTGAKFVGILFNGIPTGTTTNINNNTVAAVSMTGVTSSGTTTASPFTGILFQEGNGITNGNTIGSQASTGSLSLSTTTTSSTDVYGIFNFSSNAWTSNNNNVGGISVTNLGASGTFLVYGMRAFTGSTVTWTATANDVGGTVANSISLNATGTASQVAGMFTSNCPLLLTSNTIRNLTSNIGTGTTTTASVIGILTSSTTPNSTLSQNTIFNLSNTNATAASVVTGIQFTGSTANIVERNLIYGLTSATNSASAEINGIRVAGGTTTFRNNMVAIGAGVGNAIGGAASNSSTLGVNGINEALGTNNFYHNSVYIGGNPTAGTGASYAFNGTQTTNTRSFRDNIFQNARSNSGATGKNYAIKINGTAANPAGLTLNNNVYFANGSGGVFGFFNSLDVANLTAWKTAVGQDAASFESNPQFNDPTNTTPDLHINPVNPTIVEANGADVGVTNDFDGQTRASLTPVDIGADAGNFVTAGDLGAPVITYSNLGNTTSTTNRLLSVSVTDAGSGVPTTGIGLPRLYYRKGAVDPYVSTQCVFTAGSNYDCTFDYTLVTGGTVAAGDTIQYFVAAQDAAGTPNVAVNPSGGASGLTANPPAASTPPSPAASYLISVAFTGTKTVCAVGCDYTTLTGASGIFSAINTGVVTGNLNVQINGDLTTGEDGSVALNPITEEPVGSNFTVKFFPTGAPRAIASTTAPTGGFIRLNGADRVTFDGSLNGTGTDRSLTITEANTGTSTSVIWLQSNGTDGAQNNVVKNLNVVGQANTTTLFGIGMGSTTVGTTSVGTSNNSNTIQNNNISKTQYGIFTQGASAAAKNTGNVISQNLMNTVSPNNVAKGGIWVGFENNITISGNTVSEINQTGSPDVFGITLGFGTAMSATTSSGNEVTNATVTGNTIGNVINSGTFSAYGIGLSAATSGTSTISNNFVYGVSANGTSGDFGAGMVLGGGTGSTTRVYFNSVSMQGTVTGATAGTQTNACLAVTNSTEPTLDIRNNIFSMTQLGNTGSTARFINVALGYSGTVGNYAGLTASNNDYFNSFTNASYFTGGRGTIVTGTTFLTLANWQSETGRDSASINGNPFFLAANNLHIDSASGSTVNNAGTPIAGITTDIDNDTRNVTTPDIGADEFTPVSGPGTLQFSSTTYGGSENTSVQITVTRTLGNSGPVSVDYASADISANGGGSCGSADYISTGTQTLVWSDGDSAAKQFNVTLCPDGVADPGETFSLTLTNATGGAVIGANNPTTVTITDVPPPISGTVTVGSGGTYASLTNAGGLFSVINTVGVSGAVTVNITSDLLAETGTNSLNQFASGTLTIQPSGGAPRLVVGTNATALINLNGADGVTLNGLNTGGDSLTIRNTDTSGATIRFIADASGNTVQNCTIEGSSTSTSSGVIAFSTGTTTGNDNNLITGNVVRDRSDAAGVPANLIYSAGSSAAITNTGNIVSNNTLKNFTAAGVNTTTTGNESWTISGNTIFEEASRTTALNGLIFSSLGTNTISQNTIRDLATTSTGTTRGMQINDARLTTISRNRIYNMFESTGTLIGIEFSGSSGNAPTATFVNNMISLIPGATASQNVYGLYDNGFSGNTMNNYFNSVYVGGTASGGSQTYACRRGASAPTVSVWTDNICFNDRVLATGNSFAMGDTSDGTGTITLNFNVYVGKGVSALSFFDRGTSVTPVTFAAWQTGGRDGNSSASNPGGAYTLANMFVSSADLHASTSFSNPAGNSGTPVAGITDDFDGEVRSVSAPDIGADEFSPATNPSGVGNATPSTVPQGGAVTLTVTVTPGTNPTSTGITVTGDLSSIGGSATQQFFDDGTNGDSTGGDNIFTFATSVSIATSPGAKNLGINVSDAQARMATANISLTVTSAAAPAISVSPGSIPFGNQPVGTTSSGTTVTITNTGTADLSIGSVVTTGTNSGDFAVVNTPNNPSGATIPPGNSVMFQVTFTPSASGSRVASLSIPNNSTNDPSASVSLSGNGTQPGTLALSSATYGVSEGVGMATITVTRTGGTDGTVGISYGTSDGTATGGASCSAGVDYIIPTPGTLSWTNGDSAVKTFNITVCDDSLFESSETINASITTPTGGATLGSPNTAVLTISENDTAPTLQFSSATYSNNDDLAPGAASNDEIVPEVATITVTRTGATENAVSVNYATTAGGSATGGISCGTGSGVDYITTNGTLNFAAGVAMQTFNVTVCSDSRYEGDETVNLALSSPSMPSVLGTPNASVLTIVDNDTVPTLQFSSATYSNSDDLNSLGETTPEFAPSVSTITVTRTGAVDNVVTVDFATMGGSATGGASCTAGVDYITTSGMLTFNAGVISQTFNVTVCTDSLFEGDETVNLALSSPSAPATLGTPNAAVLTITDNDAQPSLQFSSATYSVGEGGGTSTVTVTRTGASDNAVSVNYATSNGTATGGASCGAGVDYQNASGTLNFASGDTSKTFTVTICDDALSEGDETVNLTLSSPTGGAVLGTPNTSVLTITDNDGAPSIQFSTATDSVGEAGGTITFSVTRTGATGNAVSVNYATGNVTATGGASCTTGVDFVSASGTLNFASGETLKTFNVTICNDNLFESNETLTGSLSSPGGGAVIGSPSTETVTIVENDTAPSLQFSSATGSVGEGGGSITLTATRTGATENAVGVSFSTTSGTATGSSSCIAGVDYVQVGGTLSFASGVTSQTFNVTICDDSVFESSENFTASLSSPTGGAIIGTPSTETVTITDNDTAPTLAINDVTLSEGNSGSTSFTFTVTKTGSTALNATVDFATANGTASTADSDYTPASGTVTFLPADTTKTITVLVNGDTKFEANETFFVNLTNPAGSTITDNQGQGTIANDDVAPTISINDVSISEGSSGTTSIVFTVAQSAISGVDTSVNYASADGTATTAGNDYIGVSNTATISAGSLSTTITVTVNGDTTFETNETFFVNLSGGSGYTPAGSDLQGVGTINNDDIAPTIAINDVSISEGNSGTTLFTFTVTQSALSGVATSVNFATADGTATVANSDYVSASSTATIAAGSLNTTITITVNGDTTFETNESFFVNLSGGSGYTPAGSDLQGQGTINNDDATPTLAINDVTLSEGNSGTTAFTFTVSKTGSTSQNATVDFATANGSATVADGDYAAATGTVTFLPADTTKTITVLVNGDIKFESNETFFVNLTNPTGSSITDNQGQGNISNDDAPPTISINDVSMNEGNSGTTSFVFTITQAAVSGVATSVNYATSDGTATTAGGDYTSASATASIPAGSLTATVTVLVNGDAAVEPNETFFVNLSGGSGYTAAGSDLQGQGTIQNDDGGDSTAPVITYTPIPSNPGATSLTANITDAVGVTSATIFWKINSGSFTSAPCSFSSGTAQNGNWTCTITGAPNPGAVAYYVTASDAALNTASNPTGGVTAPNLFTIGAATIPAGTYSNLRPAPSTTLGGNITVLQTLTLNGILNTGVNTLTLECSATIALGGEFNYIVGTVQKIFCATGPFTFDIGAPFAPIPPLTEEAKQPVTGETVDVVPEGAASNYSPLSVNITGGTVGSSLTVKVFDQTLSGFDPTKSVSRNWSIIESGNLTADLAFVYRNEDVNGNEADYRIYRYPGGGPIVNMCPGGPCIDPATNTGSVGGVSDFSRWQIAENLVPTVAPLNLSGRVLDASGRGIRNATLTLEGGGLPAPLVAQSGSLGWYSFEGLMPGTYLLTINGTRYSFAVPTRVVNMAEDVADADFVAEPRE